MLFERGQVGKGTSVSTPIKACRSQNLSFHIAIAMSVSVSILCETDTLFPFCIQLYSMCYVIPPCVCSLWVERWSLDSAAESMFRPSLSSTAVPDETDDETDETDTLSAQVHHATLLCHVPCSRCGGAISAPKKQKCFGVLHPVPALQDGVQQQCVFLLEELLSF